MAWNKYYIFVKSPRFTDANEVLRQLNLRQYKPVAEVPLLHSNKPQTLFVGFYNGNLLMVHPEWPFQFFHDTQSEVEKTFINAFPDSEIAVLIENSTVAHFSYALIVNGKKIRMKDGSDGVIFHDLGELLPEEKEVLSENIFEDEEIEEMKEDGMSDEEIDAVIKFEASWKVPNLITKRYLGVTVDSIDSSKVLLTRYE